VSEIRNIGHRTVPHCLDLANEKGGHGGPRPSVPSGGDLPRKMKLSDNVGRHSTASVRTFGVLLSRMPNDDAAP
jgi:hypothetical protein